MDKFILLLGITALLPAVIALDASYNVTKRQDFAYQVSLRKNGSHVCGGTIYSPKYILTAASCVNETKPSQWEVVAGNLNIQKPATNTTQKIQVSKIYVHNNFTGKYVQNNIALVKLAKELKMDNFTSSVSIARKWSTPTNRCVVSGWGANGTQYTNWPDLHAANISIGAAVQCTNYPAFLRSLQMCAGDDTMRNPCTGDLGGPLICNNTMYGIVSWRGQCNVNYQPGMYTNVTFFADWIIANAKTNSSGPTTHSGSGIWLSVAVVVFNMLYVLN